MYVDRIGHLLRSFILDSCASTYLPTPLCPPTSSNFRRSAIHPAKTMLFYAFDEAGGFFDHIVPPTPPMNAGQGKSTVSTVNESTQAPRPGSPPHTVSALACR